jgi:Acetyltransferase (GNAT) domain
MWHLSMSVSGVAGQRRRFAFVGVPAGVTYLEPFIRDRFHGDLSPTVLTRTTRSVEDVDVGLLQLSADLVVVAGPRAVVDALPGQRAVVMPFRLHLVADLDSAGRAEPSPRENKRQRRRVREYGYDYEVCRDPAAFAWFYDRLHVPTMQARHGVRQRTVPKDVACQELFENGFLFLVTAEGRRVAGVLCHIDPPGVCNARLVGWLDGDEVHLRREALKTANHFLLEWARETGFRRIDFQGCEPFLSKGTYQSKRHLGVRVVSAPPPMDRLAVWLYAAGDSVAARDFLVANPPILSTPLGFRPCYFHDRTRPVRADIAYGADGLTDAMYVNMDRPYSWSSGEGPTPAKPGRMPADSVGLRIVR